MPSKKTVGTLISAAWGHRLSAPQVWIICEAERRGGKVTAKELRNEQFSRAIISYSVRRLVEKGLAKSHAIERQSLELTLTSEGKKLAKQLR